MIKNKKGFTLIELMIVMSIIGILAVVALVAIAGKSADARDARRLADANRIQFAFSLHAIDHGSDYLEGVPSDGMSILLHEMDNKNELTYLNLDLVKDPISGRTDTCYSGSGPVQCDRAGGYTLFDLLPSDPNHMGTFDNYAIGMKLEKTESMAYLDVIDWRKFVGINSVYAAGCGDDICAYWLGENMTNCPDDCFCGDYMCNVADGETESNCASDCFCGDTVCDSEEDEVSCFYDCGVHTCGDGFCYDQTEINGVCPADCACDLNGICDGEETVSICAPDCSICNNNGYCEVPVENPGNCPADCAGGGFCGDHICYGLENPFNCPSDCLGGGGEDEDTNDWLYIGPSGVNRVSFGELDLSDKIDW